MVSTPSGSVEWIYFLLYVFHQSVQVGLYIHIIWVFFFFGLALYDFVEV